MVREARHRGARFGYTAAMYAPTDLAVVILAGGRSRRMGRDKATLELGGERLIDHAVRLASSCTDEVVVARGAAHRAPIAGLDVPQVADQWPGSGALIGIHAGLRSVAGQTVVVIACDMPLLERSYLLDLAVLIDGHDVVVPRVDAGLQPLCAVYHRSCLSAIEVNLDREERQVFAFYSEVRTREVRLDQMDGWGDREDLFLNVNSPGDLARAEVLLRDRGTG